MGFFLFVFWFVVFGWVCWVLEMVLGWVVFVCVCVYFIGMFFMFVYVCVGDGFCFGYVFDIGGGYLVCDWYC